MKRLLPLLLAAACAGPRPAGPLDLAAYKTVGIEVYAKRGGLEVEKKWLARLLKADLQAAKRFSSVYLIPEEFISADLIVRLTIKKARRRRTMKMYLDLELIDGASQQVLGGRAIISAADIRLRGERERVKSAGQIGKKVARLTLAYLDGLR